MEHNKEWISLLLIVSENEEASSQILFTFLLLQIIY